MNIITDFYQLFYNDIKHFYHFDEDILPFINDFKDIIKYTNEDFIKNITYDNNKTIEYLNSCLDIFNNTLYDQLDDSDNKYYNLSFEFNEIYNEFYNNIEDTFNDNDHKIEALRNSNTLHKYLKDYLETLQEQKRNNFKDEINKKAKSYNLELLNITINLGEYIESSAK